jgi:hypothetical protein
LIITPQSYGCLEKLYTITADNATVNNKMAQELSLQIGKFYTPTKLLGCITHVMNLAKAGISSLRKNEDEEDHKDQELSTVNIGTSHPDVALPPRCLSVLLLLIPMEPTLTPIQSSSKFMACVHKSDSLLRVSNDF